MTIKQDHDTSPPVVLADLYAAEAAQWFKQHAMPRCAAMTKKGKPCQNAPYSTATKYCALHGGNPRAAAAQRIADKLLEWQLSPAPLQAWSSSSGNYWFVVVPNKLEIRVYNVKWILVVVSDNGIAFDSEQHALAFIHASCVELDAVKADSVPRRPGRVLEGKQIVQ